jgi:putative phage-type endonuclease
MALDFKGGSMEQRTESWEEWRSKGLGSSDAPIIMGASPWLTPYQLWEQKTKRAQSKVSNWAMERGNQLEPKARAHYQLLREIDMPATLREHALYPHLRASLDGYAAQNGGRILEIKCPGKEDHAKAVAGQIPEKYIWQLVHQLAVADAAVADYFSFDGSRGVIVPFHRDLKLEQTLIEKMLPFWELVKTDTPPEYSERDFKVLRGKKEKELFTKFKNLKLEADAKAEALEQVRKEIIEQIQDPRVICADVQLMRGERKGAVDYAKIPELKQVDLEKYRKKPSVVVTLKIKNEKESA